MINKYLKYAMLLEAEVLSMTARKVQENCEEFVRRNSDPDYEKSLSNIFDGIENTFKNLSPQIEKLSSSVNKIKDNILDFPQKKVNRG